MKTCPHCNARMTVQTYERHVPSCIYDPEVKALVQAWARAEAVMVDGISHFPTILEYRRFSSENKRVPASQRIVDLFKTWANFRDFVAPDMPTLGNGRGEAIPKNWPELTADAIRRAMIEKGLSAVSCFDDIEGEVPYPYKLRKYGLVKFCWDYGFPCTAKERNFLARASVMDAPDVEPIADKSELRAAENYRCPFGKITAQAKDAAERLTAHIADETERTKEWFRLLGLPQPETIGETGD